MNIAICEDNKNDADLLRRILARYCKQNLFDGKLSLFESGEDLISAYEPGKFQMIFLDIYMNGMTGMETAKRIREKDKDCALIFTTTSMDHGIESYAVNASFYLVKPVLFEDFVLAMERCRWLLEKHTRSIEVMVNRSMQRLLLKDIRYIEAFGKYCEIHMPSDVVRSYTTLEKLHEQMDDVFVRCHRSYLVNLHHIYDLAEQDIILTDKSRIPLSRACRDAAHEAFNVYVGSMARREGM